MLNVLEENVNNTSHPENNFVGREELENGENRKTDEEEMYQALKVEQIKLKKHLTELWSMWNVEYTIQQMNVMFAYKFITSQKIYTRMKRFPQDALQNMNSLKRRINAMKKKITDLKNVRTALEERCSILD